MASPAPLQLNFNDLLGTLLLATWITSMLFAVIIRETWFYFKNFPQDRLIVKLVVVLVVLGDMANVVGTHATVYLYSISHWGDLLYLTKQYWSVFVFTVSTAIVTALVQSFLIFRYFALTRNWFFLIFCLLMMGLALASCSATAAIFMLFPEYSERFRAEVPIICWLASSAATDVLISVALIWQLFSIKTSFSQTEGVVKRLIRQTIQTGSASAIIAICTLIAYLKNNSSNVESLFAYLLEKIYVLTLLTNLNMRQNSHAQNNASEAMTMRWAREVHESILLLWIQFMHCSTVVHMDDPYTTPLDRDSRSKIDSDFITKNNFNSEIDISVV